MADHRATVAIVMRTRDRPLLLDRALADVCRQTFADWQLVVVDDGGRTGDVAAAVRRSAVPPARVRVLHNDVPRGMEAAANQGVAASDSDYIAIHDDDDTWHPNFLARTTGHLARTGDAAVAVRTEIVYEQIVDGEMVERDRELLHPQLRAFTLFEMLRINRTVPIGVLYRRDVHDEVGPFREDLPVVGDWEFYLRLALGERPLGFLDGEPLAFWHQRPRATGTAANSVIAGIDDHHAIDLRLREEALRAYGRKHGLGGLLYATAYFQREIDALQGRLGDQQGRQDRALDLLLRVQELLERQSEQLAAQAGELQRQGERLTRLETAVSDASLVSLARRRYRRWKGRALALATRRR